MPVRSASAEPCRRRSAGPAIDRRIPVGGEVKASRIEYRSRPAAPAHAAVRRPNRRDAAAAERATRQMHQAIAMTASWAVLAPVDVCPIHSPRMVSMIGVNGCTLAMSPQHGGHRVSRNECGADIGKEHEHHGERGGRLRRACEESDRRPPARTGRARRARSWRRRLPSRAASRSDASRSEADADHQRGGDQVASEAGHDVANEERRTAIGHRPESGR